MSTYVFVGAGLILATAVYFMLQPLVIILAVAGLLYTLLVFLILKSRKDIGTFGFDEPMWFSILWFIAPVVVGLVIAIIAPVWVSGLVLTYLGLCQWAAWQPIRRSEAELNAYSKRRMQQHRLASQQ